MAGLGNIVYTLLSQTTVFNVKFNTIHLLVRPLMPSAETYFNFNNFIKGSFTLSFVSWTTDKKIIKTQLENHADIGSAVKVSSSKNSIATHQTEDISATPNKQNLLQFWTTLMLEIAL